VTSWWDGRQVEPAVPGVIRKYDVLGGEPFKDENGKWRFKPLPRDQWKVREVEENVAFLGNEPVTHVVRASLMGEVLLTDASKVPKRAGRWRRHPPAAGSLRFSVRTAVAQLAALPAVAALRHTLPCFRPALRCSVPSRL